MSFCRLYSVVCLFSLIFSVGCGEDVPAPQDETPAAEPAEEITVDSSFQSPHPEFAEDDIQPWGVPKPNSYWKSSVHYPDFSHPTTRWDGHYPTACEGIKGEEAFACAEQIFWEALHFDYEFRHVAHEYLGEITQRLDADGSLHPVWLAELYMRRAQLAIALMSEQVDFAYANDPIPDLERGHEIAPDHYFLEAWLRMLELVYTIQLGGDYDTMTRELIETYEKDQPLVLGVFQGALSSMPLETGWPHRAVEYLEEVEADAGRFEGEIDWEGEYHFAPYTRPGNDLNFAEIVARIGQRERATFFLERALTYPESEKWPFRFYVTDALADMDAFLGKFTEEKTESDVVFDVMIINGIHTCQLCHTPRVE